MSREVLIVPTGTANLASVTAGITRAGGRVELVRDAGRIADAERVVLPGVGALAAARRQLDADGLADALRERVLAGRPTLAVCLGLQLLGLESEESPGTPGLGAVATRAERFPDTVMVPQMGWNRIEPDPGCRYLQPGYAYFANSYRLTAAPEPWRVAWSEHGGRFAAAIEYDEVLACQFHPELSGEWGAALLERWVKGEPAC